MKGLNDKTSNKANKDVLDYVEEEYNGLKCYDCGVFFTSEYFLNKHLLHHIKQPIVILEKFKEPRIKITLKNKNNTFEIVNNKSSTLEDHEENLATVEELSETTAKETENETNELAETDNLEKTFDEFGETEYEEITEANVNFSPNFANGEDTQNDENSPSEMLTENPSTQEYGSIPGAEPTPPPEPSPEYPKIRIKTTGLLKEPLTITEITDDNPEGNNHAPEIIELGGGDNQNSSFGSGQSDNDGANVWATPSLEDPLRLPDTNDKDDGNLLSLFGSNSERAKDFGFTSSDSEFISLDRLDDRNRNALQVYNSHAVTSTVSQNPLDTLTGLPMQQLAQQVSRLQPGSGMHQQNVLINIQQFPQAPPQPQHGYQPPMYHHPPQPHQPPMYQPYPYQPPNPMYYPPAPGYGPHMPPPQITQPMPQQPQQMPPQQQPMQQQYRPQQMPPRQPAPPRQGAPGQRAPMPAPRQVGPRHPMGARQPIAVRQRAPAIRPRGGMVGIRPQVRPRMQTPQQNNMQQRMVKRTPEQIQALQAKRKKMDVLVPDKNDDPDCQVICTQPKNTDGGLPQIQSVQGGTSDPADGNVMHLSDSITLSVRNPPPRPQSPKKSDAKAVANILATRGITVTATAKPKEKESPKKNPSPPPPVAINLNNAVSIIPAAKGGKPAASTGNESRLPTVDLTDDSAPETPQNTPSKPSPPAQKPQRGTLPFRCDLCPAQYPNAISLNKHKQSYHRTGGSCEMGVPLINLRQPGALQKLASLGIFNYIPVPGGGSEGMLGIPVVNARNPGNAAGLGATSVLTLGPIRNIPRPQQQQQQQQNHAGN